MITTEQERVRKQRAKDALLHVESIFSQPEPPIFVHQMGKVGSVSVMKTLQNANLGPRAIHLHFLSQKLDEVLSMHIKQGMIPEPVHIHESLAVRDYMERHPEQRIKVISLVRDPVARQISDLFQNPGFFKDQVRDESGNYDPAKVKEFLNTKFSNPGYLRPVFGWFDWEIKRVYDIDVFETPFGPDGYQTYHSERADLIVFRLEDVSEALLKQLGPFLGIPESEFVEVRSNVREDSSDAFVYSEVKGSIRLSREVLDGIYASRFCRYFYTPEWIEKLTERWSGQA